MNRLALSASLCLAVAAAGCATSDGTDDTDEGAEALSAGCSFSVTKNKVRLSVAQATSSTRSNLSGSSFPVRRSLIRRVYWR